MKSDDRLATYQRDLCFIDLETTGPLIGFHEIIDVGVIRTCPEAKNVLFEWCRQIAPLYPERVTAFAKNLNGFSPESWTAELPSSEFWEEFVSKVSGAVPETLLTNSSQNSDDGSSAVQLSGENPFRFFAKAVTLSG